MLLIFPYQWYSRWQSRGVTDFPYHFRNQHHSGAPLNSQFCYQHYHKIHKCWYCSYVKQLYDNWLWHAMCSEAPLWCNGWALEFWSSLVFTSVISHNIDVDSTFRFSTSYVYYRAYYLKASTRKRMLKLRRFQHHVELLTKKKSEGVWR